MKAKLNEAQIIGAGPLKLKYAVLESSRTFYGGRLCFLHGAEEIGDYGDVVNFAEVEGKLRDFSANRERRVAGFLDGEPAEVVFDFLFDQVLPDGGSYVCPLASLSEHRYLYHHKIQHIFHLDDALSFSFMDKFNGILFHDRLLGRQRFIWRACGGAVVREVVLDADYFESLIADFSRSLRHFPQHERRVLL